ncbi:MAG: hypothetical protein LBK52_02880, partial [Deltaproteobacteria bacterium]|nr:hypothetical protein [Deltaproteobacteria bacterium]
KPASVRDIRPPKAQINWLTPGLKTLTKKNFSRHEITQNSLNVVFLTAAKADLSLFRDFLWID